MKYIFLLKTGSLSTILATSEYSECNLNIITISCVLQLIKLLSNKLQRSLCRTVAQYKELKYEIFNNNHTATNLDQIQDDYW